jgi:hypothetical protein
VSWGERAKGRQRGRRSRNGEEGRAAWRAVASHTYPGVFKKLKRKFFYSDLFMNSLPPSQQIIGNFEFEKIYLPFAIAAFLFIVVYCLFFSCTFPYP